MSLADKLKEDQNVIQNAGRGNTVSYLISFRISNHDQKTYHITYDNLISEIKIIDSNFYHHTTSTYIIRSQKSVDVISTTLKTHLGPNDHLIVIELPESISSRFAGPAIDFSELQIYIPSITKI